METAAATAVRQGLPALAYIRARERPTAVAELPRGARRARRRAGRLSLHSPPRTGLRPGRVADPRRRRSPWCHPSRQARRRGRMALSRRWFAPTACSATRESLIAQEVGDELDVTLGALAVTERELAHALNLARYAAACPRPEVGPTEGSQVLGCAQHRAATKMTVRRGDRRRTPSRWRCRGHYARSKEACRGPWPTAWDASIRAVAVTGDHGERCRPLFLVALASCVTQTGWPSSAARRFLVPAVRLPRCAWSSGGFRSSAATPAQPARSRSHRRPATLLGAPRLVSSLSQRHRAIRTRSAARSRRTYEPPGVVRR